MNNTGGNNNDSVGSNGEAGIKMLKQIIRYREMFDSHKNYDNYGQYLSEFIQTLYGSQFLLIYDWTTRGIWGERVFNNPERLRKADLLDLRLLMTAAVRNDRFCEGYLESLAHVGTIKIMLNRIEELMDELKTGRSKWNTLACGPEPSEKIEYLPGYKDLESMYWIYPGRLLAGEYPGDLNTERALQKLKFLVDAGIRQVINLMEEDETNYYGEPFKPYDKKLIKLAEEAGNDIKISRIPLKDMEVPTKTEMINILDLIDQAHSEDRPVYVHCWGGRGRTGIIAGCYLVRHDVVDSKDVLQYLNDIRRNIVKGDSPSPQTEQQRSMVRHWKVGQ